MGLRLSCDFETCFKSLRQFPSRELLSYGCGGFNLHDTICQLGNLHHPDNYDSISVRVAIGIRTS